MKNKLILLLFLLIPSLCFGGDTYRLQYTIFEEQSEHLVQITSYDDPKGKVTGGLFLIFSTDEKSDYASNGIYMEKLRVYLNEEKLLSHFSEKIQKAKFKRFQFYNEELILKQFLSSAYKVTAFNTENITFGENKMKGLKKTYFFSKQSSERSVLIRIITNFEENTQTIFFTNSETQSLDLYVLKIKSGNIFVEDNIKELDNLNKKIIITIGGLPKFSRGDKSFSYVISGAEIIETAILNNWQMTFKEERRSEKQNTELIYIYKQDK